MGNLLQSNTHLQLQRNYKIVKQAHHDLTLLQELATKNQYCLKRFVFNSTEGLEACVEKMNIKKRAYHQHLLSIKDIISRTENSFCGNINRVFVLIQYPFRTLQEEIEERRTNWNYFNETEIWSILYSCSMALSYLYSTNLTHESLTSNRIYIQNNGFIKICDPTLLGHTNNLISFTTKSSSQHVYLSPEQISGLPSTDVRLLQIEPSDVFVLGMIMLQIIHLQGMEQIYDNGINYKNLAGKISTVGIRYSSKLRVIIQKMLTNRIEERITFEKLQDFVENGDLDYQSEQSQPSVRRQSYLETRKPLNSITFQRNSQIPHKNKTKPTIISLGNSNNRFNKSAQDQKNMLNYNQFKGANENSATNHLFEYRNPNMNSNFHEGSYLAPSSLIQGHNPRGYHSSINQHYDIGVKYPLISLTNSNSIKNYNLPQNIILARSNNNFFCESPNTPPNSILSDFYKASLRQSPTQNNQILALDAYQKSSIYKIQRDHDQVMLQKSNFIIDNHKHNCILNKPLEKSKLQMSNFQLQKLETINELQQVQKQYSQQSNGEQPNLTIAEVTESDISGIESSSKQSNKNAQNLLIYVNEGSQSGSHYEGYKLNGKKHGFGRLYYQDGGYYEGEWENNKMNGFAKLYYQSGEIAYEGYWMNDKLHGRGKVYNDNPVQLLQDFNYRDFSKLDDYWLQYDGQFQMDAKHGLGSIKLTNGQMFQGGFKNDVIQGKGKFYCSSGKVMVGIWRQNKLFQSS